MANTKTPKKIAAKDNLMNRELSWLLFNERVMQEAEDASVPLVQRLRFLGIYSNNLDEFFKVRIASLKRMIEFPTTPVKKIAGGYTPEQLMPMLQERIAANQDVFDSVYYSLLKELEDKHNTFVVNEQMLNAEQKIFVRNYFADNVSPQLVPLMLRKNVQLPVIADDKIYLAVRMVDSSKKSPYTYAIVELPVGGSIPRFVVLPSPEGTTHIIFLDDIVRSCLDEIFFMFEFDQISAYAFKFTRDAEITLDDDISKSYLAKMEDGLNMRTKGRPVRMNYDRDMPQDLFLVLMKKLGLKVDDNVLSGGRYHQMRDLMKFPRVNSELEAYIPASVEHRKIKPFSSIINVIKKRDVLLAYPYHSFRYVIDFLREAAVDPKVQEIYITLYRVADRSKVINALKNAAKNGKTVVVLVELLARFDEENNIYWTEELQQAGIKVINGVDGLKVHSKLILVRRREGMDLVPYTYVGTGNFNESTSKIYTDFGLLTSHRGVGDDAMMVFEFLMKNHKRFDCKYLLVSPYNMRKQFIRMIDHEIAAARAGKPAYIYAKMNSLVDEGVIERLYRASSAGVEVRLIVRGACCLKPQVAGLSANIQIISIVDILLEHSRMAIFCNGGNEQTYIMSADWMSRNLDRRVEVGVPIFDPQIREILKSYFEIEWSDNVKARDLSSGAKNTYVQNDKPECRSQMAIYDFFKELSAK